MQVLQLFIFISLVVCTSLCKSSTAASPFWKNITVTPSGRGDYKTIQEAIDKGVPENNAAWVHIFIVRGTYWGNVTIPSNKQYIVLEGESRRKIGVDFNTSVNINNSTLIVEADNFIARRITFKNTFNHQLKDELGNPIKPAVAADIKGDKNAFYECGFVGVQDTLYDFSGRHYFCDCYIEGFVDFIMGNGRSVYQRCLIQSTGEGFITAQRRTQESEPTGFVFKFSVVVGIGPTYLGRAWGPYSRVLFYKSNFGDLVAPRGWDAWDYSGHENQLSYDEVGCTGPGSDTSQRVSWINKLPPSTKDWLLGPTYIDEDGWLAKQPLPLP